MLGRHCFHLLSASALLLSPALLRAQAVPWATTVAPAVEDQPLAEDSGTAGLAQTLRKLDTWASVMMIVAHPDDEDGGMMTLLSRGEGARATLFTLTRGEGGQNAMTGDTYDALGLIRTEELLAADRYEGVEQRWGRFADYGFSKTKEEAFGEWGREEVMRDAVLAVRTVRPLVVTSVFDGGITDGHGHHQVAGEIAQQVFTAAGDPSVFPDQIAAGLAPWHPLGVFERAPFAPLSARGMYDYATNKWAPAHFYNYVTKQWSTSAPSADVRFDEGARDPLLGRSYFQIAREGWSQQLSQYGGGTAALPGPAEATYHRYGSLVQGLPSVAPSFFSGIDTSLQGLAIFTPGDVAFANGLRALSNTVTNARASYRSEHPERIAPLLAEGSKQTSALLDEVAKSKLGVEQKSSLEHELQIKLAQFNTALVESLGLEVHALVEGASDANGLTPGESRRTVSPGESFGVRVHLCAANGWGGETGLALGHVSLQTPEGENWIASGGDQPAPQASVVDAHFRVEVPRDAAPTEPYFHRSSIEQATYTLSRPSLVGQSHAPYPVSGWAELTYHGVTIRLGEVVQTTHREQGRGMVFQPLVVVPRFSVALPQAVAILPSGAHELSVTAEVTNEQTTPATAQLQLKLPAGWQAEPASVPLQLKPGEHAEQKFTVHAASQTPGAAAELTASLTSDAEHFSRGFRTVGYPGLTPSYLYTPATVRVQPVDVRVAPGLKVGYVMGTGDAVPAAIEALGVPVHLLSQDELLSGDLSRYTTLVLGVRTYTARPELREANSRLLSWVQAGGTLLVQYQGPEFDGSAPFSLTLSGAEGQAPERVVEEHTPVKLLLPNDPLLASPNRLTAADFDGWYEERGHGFAAHWGPEFAALTETADPGQDPQRGGLLEAAVGRGHYVYVAYALYRQLPEGVPGAYRLLANLLSAGRATP